MVKSDRGAGMEDPFIIVPCKLCGAKNKIPKARLNQKASCGKCHKPIAIPTYPDHPIDVSDVNFRGEVLEFSGAVLVVFWVPWCGACKMVIPMLDGLARKYAGRIKIVKVNVEQTPMTSNYYGINSTPTLHFYKKGALVKTLIGAAPQEELEENIRYILS
jgi:thioredoxin 2